MGYYLAFPLASTRCLGWRPDSEGTPYDFQNQIAYLKQADMEDINSTFTRLQAWAKATIIPGLTLNADFTYSIYNRNEEYAYLPVISWPSWGRTLSAPTYRVSQASTTATKANSVNNRWTFNAYATYDLTVADNNNFKLMLGTNIEQNTYGWFQARTKVLLDNNLPALNLYTGDLVAPGNEDNHWATAGFFGRFNYDYKGIYLAEFNGRYDGSSRFPANDQWAFFASGSIGYRFSEEAYFEPLKEWWSNGKIRASYGEIGNEAVGTNMFLATVTTSNIDYLNHSTGILINAAGTPKLVSPQSHMGTHPHYRRRYRPRLLQQLTHRQLRLVPARHPRHARCRCTAPLRTRRRHPLRQQRLAPHYRLGTHPRLEQELRRLGCICKLQHSRRTHQNHKMEQPHPLAHRQLLRSRIRSNLGS